MDVIDVVRSDAGRLDPRPATSEPRDGDNVRMSIKVKDRATVASTTSRGCSPATNRIDTAKRAGASARARDRNLPAEPEVLRS